MIYFFVGKREDGRHQKYILVRVQKHCSENICIVEIFLGMICFWVCIQPGFAEDRTRLNLLKSWVKVG